MIKRFNAFICISLCVTLLMAVGGCQQKNADVKSTATATQSISTGTVGTVAPTVTPRVTPLTPVDLHGREVRVISEFYSDFGKGKVGKAVDVMSTKTEKGQKMLDRIKRVQKTNNCTIKFAGKASFDFWEKTMTSSLAGDPAADFGKVGGWYIYRGLAQGGAYMPLDKFKDILQPDDSSLWNVKVDKTDLSYNGMSLAMLPRPVGAELALEGMVMYFNKDMLRREGLWSKYNLYEMQKNKTWNWSSFEELCRKVTKDKDGDGEYDQVGCNYSEFLLRALMHTSVNNDQNGGWINILPNGSAKVVINDKGHKPALSLLIQMFKKGILSAETGTVELNKVSMSMFIQGSAAFTVDFGNEIKNIKQAKMQDAWGVAAMPISPNGKQDYILPMDYFDPYVILGNVKKPNEIAHMMRTLVPPEPMSEEEELVSSEAYLANYVGSEQGIIDTLNMLSDPSRISTSTDSYFLGGIGIPMWVFFYNVSSAVNGTITMEQLFQMTLPKFQAQVNDYWGSVQKGAVRLKKDVQAGKR